jgi:hypothetical protein
MAGRFWEEQVQTKVFRWAYTQIYDMGEKQISFGSLEKNKGYEMQCCPWSPGAKES